MELIIPQMSSACYAIRSSICSFSDTATLNMIYLACLPPLDNGICNYILG